MVLLEAEGVLLCQEVGLGEVLVGLVADGEATLANVVVDVQVTSQVTNPVLEKSSLSALKSIDPLYFVLPLPAHLHPVEPRHDEPEEGKYQTGLFHFFQLPSLFYLRVDVDFEVLSIAVGIICERVYCCQVGFSVEQQDAIKLSDMVGGQISQVIVGCCSFHLVDLPEHLSIETGAGGGHVVDVAVGHGWSEVRSQAVDCRLDYFLDDLAGHYWWRYFGLNYNQVALPWRMPSDNKVVQLMDSPAHPEQVEKAYILQHKVTCPKHPSKTIEYFCKHPQCTDRLSCSSCLLKKQYCRHDINTFIMDIAELLYEMKMTFEMKGLSKEADIHDYLINKESRRKMYDDVVDTEIGRFEGELDEMLKSITKTINDLKENIVGQLTEFKLSYQKTQELMLKRVEEAFSTSYMASYQNFESVLASKEHTNSIGLRELLEKLVFEGGDESKSKDIRKLYQNLMSMHDETPQIDYNRLQSIKSYFNVFENKLSQAGPLLITLHKSASAVSPQKQANPHAQIDNLASIPASGAKKIAKSASFASNHTRTVYVALKIPERKVLTGSDDGAVNMFDMTTFENIGNFQCHIGGIRSMITLPNHKLVTGSYDKTIKIWPDPNKFGDMTSSNMQLSQLSTASKKNPTLNPLKTLTGHTSCIISLKYLNDGIHFASGSADYSIKVWDYEKGQNTKNFTGHMSDILCLQCTSTGNTLISGSADRTIKVWSLTKKYSSACLKTMTGHLDFIWTIVLLQDNVTLLSAGLDKSIKMWDITNGNLIRNLPTQHTSHITKLIQFAKQIVISCSNDGTIKFWDYKGNACLHTVQLESGLSTMMLTAEQGIIAVGQDKNIYLCD